MSFEDLRGDGILGVLMQSGLIMILDLTYSLDRGREESYSFLEDLNVSISEIIDNWLSNAIK